MRGQNSSACQPNANAHADRKTAADTQLHLRHGEKMIFGTDKDKGIAFNADTYALAYAGSAGGTIKTFTIRPREPIPFEAGQFVELMIPGGGEAPFTPSSSPRVTDHMEITIMQTGRVTARLHELGPGAEVGVRGPLGRG